MGAILVDEDESWRHREASLELAVIGRVVPTAARAIAVKACMELRSAEGGEGVCIVYTAANDAEKAASDVLP